MSNGYKKMIVGLGNPGSQYAKTRHNSGVLLLTQLASELGVSLQYKSSDFAVAETRFSLKPLKTKSVLSRFDRIEVGVILLRLHSYMNLSGKPIAKALQHFRMQPSSLLVLHDEIDIAFGDIRLKHGGGHGGHNGLRNIIEFIGKDFSRLRFGIGRSQSGAQVANYVLSPFTEEETPQLSQLLEKAQDMCLSWLNETPTIEN